MTPGIDHGDFENELRDLFREKAERAPLATPTLPASAPQRVLRRGRLHQVGTVLGSAVVVVALIVGSVAGLTRILGDGPDTIETGDYEIFQRTATVEAFTVGSPSDWYLVNQWPLSMLIAVEGSGGSSDACVAVPGDVVQGCNDTGEETSSPIPVPHGLPMLQLSNVDLGLAANACTDGIPGDGAALYVALDYDAAIAGIADPSIQEFPAGTGLPPEGDGPCGPGRYAYFTVNGERFFSWIGVGSGASDEDRETIETSYRMMSAIPGWTPTPPNEATPAYVIAGGEHGPGDDWRIELRPDGDAIQLSLDAGPAPDVLLTDGSVGPPTWTGTDPIFGVVTKEATGVEFRPGTENDDLDVGQSPVAGTLVPVPPTLGAFGFDLFFIDPPAGYGELGGRVVALGVELPSDEPPPVAETRGEERSFSAGFRGQTWIVRLTGSFAEGNACIHVTIASETFEPLCHAPRANPLVAEQPSSDAWMTDELYLLVNAMPPSVDGLRFEKDDGTEFPQEYQCALGPSGWTDPDRKVCVSLFPPEGSGVLQFLDAEGRVLFEHGMGWGSAEFEEPTPMPVSPVHGGTYWAVYPWVGAAGSPEADDVSAALLQDFGIEAFPGDLACDQGAAEALGTNAEQGIGVYFETEDDANAFASQAGLLGHEADPVIAQVTTYCLD
jgi:hypothetical protein